MGCRQRVHGLATGADRQEKGAEDGWERGNLTTEGALPYRRISNAAKRFSPTFYIRSLSLCCTQRWLVCMQRANLRNCLLATLGFDATKTDGTPQQLLDVT